MCSNYHLLTNSDIIFCSKQVCYVNIFLSSAIPRPIRYFNRLSVFYD